MTITVFIPLVCVAEVPATVSALLLAVKVITRRDVAQSLNGVSLETDGLGLSLCAVLSYNYLS
jgi:hypothetical protein